MEQVCFWLEATIPSSHFGGIYSQLFFALGAFLLGLNIYGEFVSLRNPKINNGIMYFNVFRKPQESPEQVFKQIDKGQNESSREYAYRLTELVYSATVHKWEDVIDYTEYNHQSLLMKITSFGR